MLFYISLWNEVGNTFRSQQHQACPAASLLVRLSVFFYEPQVEAIGTVYYLSRVWNVFRNAYTHVPPCFVSYSCSATYIIKVSIKLRVEGKYVCYTVRHSVEVASLHQQAGINISSIVKQFKQYSPATVYRHCKNPPIDKRKFNRGRPSKLTPQGKRSILRAVPKLCQSDGSFTSPPIAMDAGVADKVHGRTVRRVLNTASYHYCSSRKKGLLRAANFNARLDFCENIRKKKLGQSF